MIILTKNKSDYEEVILKEIDPSIREQYPVEPDIEGSTPAFGMVLKRE